MLANKKSATASVLNSTALAVLLLFSLLLSSGCKSAPKATDGHPKAEFKSFEGKKIAFVEVDTVRGGETARKVVEVSLVNELLKRGTFELVSKEEIAAARAEPEQDPTDLIGIAKRTGAQASLRIKVLEFLSEEKQGYSEQEIEDSYLEKERGKSDKKNTRLYKVKALDSKVQYQIELRDLTQEPNPIFTDTIEKKSRIEADESKGRAARLPPRLRVLESLSQAAFVDFFDRASR